jgi:hypothetical protein
VNEWFLVRLVRSFVLSVRVPLIKLSQDIWHAIIKEGSFVNTIGNDSARHAAQTHTAEHSAIFTLQESKGIPSSFLSLLITTVSSSESSQQILLIVMTLPICLQLTQPLAR